MKNQIQKMLSLLFLYSLIYVMGCSEPSPYEPYTYTKKYWNIHIMNVDGSNMINLTKSEEHYRLWDISPLGSKILYTSNNGTHSMNLDGSNKKTLAQGIRQFSPDETKIIYISSAGEGEELCIMNNDGTNVMSLDSTYRYGFTSVKFSPDGSKIVYAISDSIYTINIVGGNKEYLTSGDYPQYTPDGSNIVYYYDQDLHRMNSDGSNITNITNGLGSYFLFTISPDGLKICFHYNESSNHYIVVMDIDGNNRIVLTEIIPAMGQSNKVRFSPDGLKIIYFNIENGSFEIYVIDVNGSNKKNLLSHILEDCIAPIYTSDGSRIIFQKWTDVQND